MIVRDPDGRVIEWLPAAVKIVSYEGDEMIGEAGSPRRSFPAIASYVPHPI